MKLAWISLGYLLSSQMLRLMCVWQGFLLGSHCHSLEFAGTACSWTLAQVSPASPPSYVSPLLSYFQP